MNIGFDAKRVFHNRSGLGNYSRSTMKLLSRFYPEHSYFLYSARSNRDLFSPSANQLVVKPESRLDQYFPGFWRSWGISKQIQWNKLDIYHGLSNELPLSIKKAGVKSVVTIHDLIFLRYPEYYSSIDRKIYTYKFRHACRVADIIFATSNATKADIVSYFGTDPQKIEVVYQSCDPIFSSQVDTVKRHEIRKKYNLPEQFILYLGTIEKRKNVLSLIRAYVNENNDIPLVIAGKPTSYISEINNFLVQKPASSRIFFRYNIESVDLPALYQSALIFVYPSVFEGFGIPILEALNSGVPVITSTGSCFNETGGDAALYCKPNEVEQIGYGMTKLLNDSALRQSMIEKGFLHARHFTEDVVAKHIMKLYSDLLRK